MEKDLEVTGARKSENFHMDDATWEIINQFFEK
jgi:hypothetical protein